MRVLIIEDEAPAFRRLEKTLTELRPSIEIVEVLDSVEDSIKWFNSHQMPELVMMDIQISDGISFQIFDKVDVTCPVIFTTAFDEYLLKAFKVNSIDYLLKPIKKDELASALMKYDKFYQGNASVGVDIAALLHKINLSEPNYKSRFLVKQGDKMLSIRSSDIVCFQSKHGVVHIVTQNNRTFISDFTLDELCSQIDPKQFFRANRQFIINAEFIATVHKHFKGKLLVDVDHFTEDKILVSAEKASSFKKWLDQ